MNTHNLIVADSRNLILLEWPEHVSAIVPERAIRVTLTCMGDDARHITYDENKN